MKKDIDILIPTYNESGNIKKTVLDLKEKGYINITILDAQSEDDTVKITQKLGCKILIDENKKMGFGHSVINGINLSEKKYCCVFDADGSFDSNSIEIMINELNKGNEFVFCSRYLGGKKSQDDTKVTRFGNFFFTKLIRAIYGFNTTDVLFLFCISKTETFKKLNLKSKDFTICTEILIKAYQNFKCKEIFSQEKKREYGTSKVNKILDGLKILQNIFKLYFF
tara:strand:- start:1313 stop:1984 length:672 start_codon:yes stop_codon:yes gene_type:complete